MTIHWKNILFMAAMGKAIVAGVALSFAALGALDVAFAVAAEEWWQAVRPDWLLNGFAAFGVIGGIVSQIFGIVFR